MKFGQGFLGAPLQHRVGWGTASLHGVTVGVCPGRGLEGRPGCPLGVVCAEPVDTLFRFRLFRSSSGAFFGLFVSFCPLFAPTVRALQAF